MTVGEHQYSQGGTHTVTRAASTVIRGRRGSPSTVTGAGGEAPVL